MTLPYENATSGAAAMEEAQTPQSTRGPPVKCKLGHDLTGSNISWVNDVSRPAGRRWLCKECHRLRQGKRYDVEREKRRLRREARVEDWKRQVSSADLEWAAGHFEGEGTISLSSSRRGGYARPIVSLCSTDREVITIFSGFWPSSMAGKKPRVPSVNARPVYRWEINSAVRVRAFIDQVEPHLRTERCKRKFALVSEFVNLMLQPSTGKRRPRYPQYIDAIRRLNQRGAHNSYANCESVLQMVTSQELLPAPQPKA